MSSSAIHFAASAARLAKKTGGPDALPPSDTERVYNLLLLAIVASSSRRR